MEEEKNRYKLRHHRPPEQLLWEYGTNSPAELRQWTQLFTKSPANLCWGLRWCWSLLQTCTKVSAAPTFEYSNSQSRSILNATQYLQVVSGAPGNNLAESESTLQSSREAWEHLKVLRSTGEGYRSDWELGVLHVDRYTFCWWSPSKLSSCQVVPTVHPSNTATIMPSSGNSTHNWWPRIEDTSLSIWQCF